MIPSYWWHHVEQIDAELLPISYTLFSADRAWSEELRDE